MIKNLPNSVNKKKLIFTITTGRSGTGYLARIMSNIKQTVSLHEPNPSFSDYMRIIQNDKDKAEEFWITKKLPSIYKYKKKNYIETSHLFCKGFIESLINLEIIPDIIILRRNPRDVALSLWKINTIPGKTDKGFKYLLSPDDQGVLNLPNWQFLHDYQLCYWYTLEIERRAQIYKKLFQKYNSRICELSFSELTNSNDILPKIIERLKLPKLGLIQRYIYNNSRTRKVNTKNEQKSKIEPQNLDELENEVLESTGFKF